MFNTVSQNEFHMTYIRFHADTNRLSGGGAIFHFKENAKLLGFKPCQVRRSLIFCPASYNTEPACMAC